MTLLVAPCTHEAALYAVMHWHYSRAMPIGKLVTLGAWEDDRFVGAVVFGRGATPALGAPFGLAQTEVCELVRVALTTHVAPVSQIVARSLRLLRERNADPNRGHHGGIYQAGGWIYSGESPPMHEVLFDGKWLHNRMLNPSGWGSVPRLAQLSREQQAALPRRRRRGKYRYLYPLDRAMRRAVAGRALPFPTRLADQGSTVS